ncbi:type VI secretion system baseplate subunit TssE [Celerinatantimonas sp. YJH-8]|uniref:type VI secretion system baseplate subunit TssE n=1 Tax=Celerinatantimonas sp. YJH-8 TaxID=3228714 RepID=UPI0038C5E947
MGYVALEESAYGVSFFERLEADAPARSMTQGPKAEDVLDSIKRNISNVLNTRIGESMSAPLLGLIDFNDATLGSRDLALQIRMAIRKCLKLYEPRLNQLDVRVLNDPDSPLNLRFHVTAQINRGALHDGVQIDLLLDNSRKYRVI